MCSLISKNTVLVALIIILSTYTATAQQKTLPTADTLAGHYARMISGQLFLTGVQQLKLQAAYRSRLSEIETLPPFNGKDTAGRQQALEKLHLNYEKALKSILTADQFQQYQQRRAEKVVEPKGGS